MRLPLILFAALSFALASPAGAAEKKEEPAPLYVDISPVALPVVYQGKLLNYVFVNVRVLLTKKADPMAVRTKEPFFRDALVRAGHRKPFTRLDDFTKIDEAALKAVLTPEVSRLAGPGLVSGVQVMVQTPKRRTGLPVPPQLKTGPARRPVG